MTQILWVRLLRHVTKSGSYKVTIFGMHDLLSIWKKYITSL